MKKALVIGFGVSGKSAKALLEHQGYAVTVYDDSLESGNIDPNTFDEVILSPGIPLSHPLCMRTEKRIISEVELGLQSAKNPMIGVTGTNGKTTFCLFLEHLFASVGIKAKAIGNVGVPVASYFINPDREEILIVELSSFQLETMYTPVFDIGIILNITPDHLDRYPSMKEYTEAKMRLKNCVKSSFYFEPSDPIMTVASHYAISEKQIKDALATFTRPDHRMQLVQTIDDIDFINDSKATNIDSVLYAINSIAKPVVLIAGGFDKKVSFASWKQPFSQKVRCVIAIGQTAKQISDEIGKECEVIVAENLPLAVKLAHKLAKSGDCVLLSPGCSSYDQFANYIERGQLFAKAVKEVK